MEERNMNKYKSQNKLTKIMFYICAIIFLGLVFSRFGFIKTGEKEIVPCYDEKDNLMIGVNCEYQIIHFNYFNIFVMMSIGMVAFLLLIKKWEDIIP